MNYGQYETKTSLLYFVCPLLGLAYAAVVKFLRLIPGDTDNGWALYLAIGVGAGLMFLTFVKYSVVLRQLALPGSIVGALYVYYYKNSIAFILIAIFIAIQMLAIGLIEARSTTGKYSDFWRSFIFHPLSWGKHMNVRIFEKYDVKPTPVEAISQINKENEGDEIRNRIILPKDVSLKDLNSHKATESKEIKTIENISNEMGEKLICSKCGFKDLDFDKYWNEYVCKNCGFIFKK
jgi:hypothetical protein